MQPILWKNDKFLEDKLSSLDPEYVFVVTVLSHFLTISISIYRSYQERCKKRNQVIIKIKGYPFATPS